MPSSWRIQLAGLDPDRVGPEALHGALSRILDVGRHHAPVKDWSAALFASGRNSAEILVGLASVDAERRFADRFSKTAQWSIGTQRSVRVAELQRVRAATWPELCSWSGSHAWELTFVTPVTFRNGDRTSPMPSPDAVLTGLGARIRALASEAAIEPMSPRELRAVWVTDLIGASELRTMRRGGTVEIAVSGFAGRIRYECGDSGIAAKVDTLLRASEFCGVGSFTPWGFGAVRLTPTWQPATAR